jgi:hypothetical protein
LREGLYVVEIVDHSGGGPSSPAPDHAYTLERYGSWIRLTPYVWDRSAEIWRSETDTVHLLRMETPDTARNDRMVLIAGDGTFRLQLIEQRVELVYGTR